MMAMSIRSESRLDDLRFVPLDPSEFVSREKSGTDRRLFLSIEYSDDPKRKPDLRDVVISRAWITQEGLQIRAFCLDNQVWRTFKAAAISKSCYGFSKKSIEEPQNFLSKIAEPHEMGGALEKLFDSVSASLLCMMSLIRQSDRWSADRFAVVAEAIREDVDSLAPGADNRLVQQVILLGTCCVPSGPMIEAAIRRVLDDRRLRMRMPQRLRSMLTSMAEQNLQEIDALLDLAKRFEKAKLSTASFDAAKDVREATFA